MSIAFILRTLVFRMKHKASWCCWSHGQRFQIVEWPELSNILCCVTTRIVVGLRFVFHTSLPPDGSSPSINKFPCRIGVWNDRADWFFSADLPPSTPMSTTSKVKCHGMICELRRSLGPLRHKTYEPLRLKGWRELWGPQLGMSWVKGKYQTSRPEHGLISFGKDGTLGLRPETSADNCLPDLRQLLTQRGRWVSLGFSNLDTS